MQTIDLRSDTVTLPTSAMREAMLSAPLGDDVFGEDPSILKLEADVAKMFGKEAALFCPSGTMCNQIAIQAHTRPGDQMICYENAHVYLYEGGGAAVQAGVTARLIPGNLGIMDAKVVEANINVDDPHFPKTSLVCIENTVNKGGGACWPLADMQTMQRLCQKHGLALHLDGARLMNAVVAMGYSPLEVGACVDSISLCLSKGLGAPVGSVLVGGTAFIAESRRIRKRMGGGMRQAGILAAAGSYALQNHVERLATDHEHAQQLAAHLATCDWVEEVLPCPTNIVIFAPKSSPEEALNAFDKMGVRGVPFGKTYIRWVTHLDIDPSMIARVIAACDAMTY